MLARTAVEKPWTTGTARTATARAIGDALTSSSSPAAKSIFEMHWLAAEVNEAPTDGACRKRPGTAVQERSSGMRIVTGRAMPPFHGTSRTAGC